MPPASQVLDTAELLSIIFAFLQSSLENDEDLATRNGTVPTSLSTHWKGFFTRLALVNRSFFHASVGVIWEAVPSLEPFSPLLEMSGATDGLSKAYSRFNFYSSKTKCLTLAPTNMPLSTRACWERLTESSTYHLGPLFPALREVYLKSTDATSVKIARSACSYLKLLELDLVCFIPPAWPLEVAADLSAELARRPSPPSIIRVRPAGSQALQNLSKLQRLEQIRVSLTCDDIPSIGPNFWSHDRIIFEERGRGPNFEFQASSAVDIQFLRQLEAQLPRCLRIQGGSRMQSELAFKCDKFRPSNASFDVVVLDLPHNGIRNEDLLAPKAIGAYITKNTSLTALSVTSLPGPPRRAIAQMEAIERARASPTFCDTDSFLRPLAARKNLTLLSITGIFFKSVDIIVEVLSILRDLPLLESFTFFPSSMSSHEMDKLTLPVLAVLKDVQRHNPLLRIFGTHMELRSGLEDLLVDVPSIDQLSTHPLESLILLPGFDYKLPVYSPAEVHVVALYLACLFPNLHDFSGSSNSMKKFWKVIYEEIVWLGYDGDSDHEQQGTDDVWVDVPIFLDTYSL